MRVVENPSAMLPQCLRNLKKVSFYNFASEASYVNALKSKSMNSSETILLIFKALYLTLKKKWKC